MPKLFLSLLTFSLLTLSIAARPYVLVLSQEDFKDEVPADSDSAETHYFTVDHEFYPYYPSLIKWNKSSAPFTEPAVCAGCHPQQF